jgi:hypothetical protein
MKNHKKEPYMFIWDRDLWDVMPCRLVHSWAVHRLHSIMRRDRTARAVKLKTTNWIKFLTAGGFFYPP